MSLGFALEIGVRGLIAHDAGIGRDGAGARDGSGVDGLPVLDAVDVPAAAVDAMRARIGDPASTWGDGVISAANEAARRAGVAPGQTAGAAARSMLGRPRMQ